MLTLRELVKVYPGDLCALSSVDLDVPPGMFGLLGPNGAGKSTLLRIAAGLLEPTSGSAAFGEIDIVAEPERLRPRLGYLPQAFGFYPNLTGAAMLDHLLRLKGIDGPRGRARLVAELLERVHLEAASGRKVKTYSGGMRQRLGIAQAIAGAPELLIVDEPTAGLDPEERQRFHRLLAEVASERTVIFSTHLVEDVAELCPRFAILSQGRILAATRPSAAREALAGTIFEGAVDPQRLLEIAGRVRVVRAVLREGRTWLRLHVPEGLPPEDFFPTPATLEDAYLLAVEGERPVSPEAAA